MTTTVLRSMAGDLVPVSVAPFQVALGIRPRLAGGPLRVIPAGDSITQGGNGGTPGQPQYGDNAIWEPCLYQAGDRYQIIRNAGVAGNTSADLLARFQTDVLDYSPNVVPILIGANDIGQSVPIATTMNNIQSMVRMCLGAGVMPILATPTPYNSKTAECQALQPYYYRLARAWGIPLVDFFRVLADPTTGNWVSGDTPDNIHPNYKAIQKVATAFGPVLRNLETVHCPPYLAAASQTSQGIVSNLIRNGNFVRQASAPVPDNWTANQTNITLTAPTAAQPYTGVSPNMVKSASGGAYALTTTVTSGYSVGDRMLFTGRVSVSSLAASPSGWSVILDMPGSGGLAAKPMNSYKLNGDNVFSIELVVPSGTTSLGPQFYIADTGTYAISNWTLLNQTAMDAVWSPTTY